MTSAPTSSGSSGASACGDGVVNQDEACDDGNTVKGDGCNNDCTKSGEMLWEYRSSWPMRDEFQAVAIGEGTIFAGGRREIDDTNGFDRWIERLSFTGEELGSTTLSAGVTFENVMALAATPTELYAAGSINTGDQSVWVAKLALDGSVLWEDNFDSGFGDDFVTGIGVTGQGIVVTGSISLDTGLGATWTRAYDEGGGILWTFAHPTQEKSSYSFGPALSSAQDLVVVGFYELSPQSTFLEKLLAFPPQGSTPAWTQTYPNDGAIVAVARALGGDIVVATQTLGLGLGVRRLTSTGEPVWSSFGCLGESGKAIAVDSQGDVVVIGWGKAGTSDNIRLCKFSASGEPRWGKDLDGGVGSKDRGSDVAILPDDSIVVAGYMTSATNFTDGWVAVFSP